jgi:hypothetical protein
MRYVSSDAMSQPYDAPPTHAPPPRLSKKDEEQIDLLGILFYVYGAFVGFTALIFGGFALVGLALLSGAAPGATRPEPDPLILGVAVLVLFGAVALFFTAKAVVMFLAGRALRRRTGYVLAMVAAFLALINLPLGTALGVFAIVTLQRPEVKARLGAA